MSVTVASITPQRLRGSGSVTIVGTGFSGTPGQNDVLVAGSSGSISAESTTSITFTLPFLFSAGIIRNVHTKCQVINYDTGESFIFWLWIMPTVAEVGAYGLAIESPIPGYAELVASDERPRVFEARDFHRLCAALEVLTRDPAGGQVLSFDGVGAALPAGSPALGSVLVADSAEAAGVAWRLKQDVVLSFGGTFTGGPVLLAADGTTAAAPAGETDQCVPYAGNLSALSILYKGSGTLDQVRVLVDGSVEYDSGSGLAIATNGVHNASPAIAVTQGQRVRVDVTNTGGGTDSAIGYVLLTE